MKTLFAFVSLLLISSVSVLAQDKTPDFGLPELHEIKTVTLSPSYSCRAPEDFEKGYANTALFLSAFAKQRNSPDLLFNGACKSDDKFDVNTAGDDFSLIADLGAEVSVEEVTAHRAFNLKGVADFAAYSKFVASSKVELNHVYAVLINKQQRRGLFIFKVIEFVPNERVVLRYAVKSYQITPTNGVRSEGFAWEELSY